MEADTFYLRLCFVIVKLLRGTNQRFRNRVREYNKLVICSRYRILPTVWKYYYPIETKTIVCVWIIGFRFSKKSILTYYYTIPTIIHNIIHERLRFCFLYLFIKNSPNSRIGYFISYTLLILLSVCILLSLIGTYYIIIKFRFS